MKRNEKVLIVEPSTIITEGLIKILKENTSFELLPPLSDATHLKDLLVKSNPDILILNPTLLSFAKNVALQPLFQDFPYLVVLPLVYQYVEPSTLRYFEHGVLDICQAPLSIVTLLQNALHVIEENKVAPADNYELSKREIDVLVLVSKGFMSKEIADKLNISVHTVISHRKNITRKTNIKSIAGLAMYALMNNLIDEADIA